MRSLHIFCNFFIKYHYHRHATDNFNVFKNDSTRHNLSALHIDQHVEVPVHPLYGRRKSRNVQTVHLIWHYSPALTIPPLLAILSLLSHSVSGCSLAAKAPALGAGDRGFKSLHPESVRP